MMREVIQVAVVGGRDIDQWGWGWRRWPGRLFWYTDGVESATVRASSRSDAIAQLRASPGIVGRIGWGDKL